MYIENAGCRLSKCFFTKLYASAQSYRLSSRPLVLPIRIRLEVAKQLDNKRKREKERTTSATQSVVDRFFFARARALGNELSTRPFAVLRCRKTRHCLCTHTHYHEEICRSLIRENVASLSSDFI